MRWAKQQGATLVVAVNDDVSAWRQKKGDYVLPLEERAHIIACQEAVDWVIPFGEDTPEKLLLALGVDILVKGNEYAGQKVPGHDLVKEVRFAPPDEFANHCSAVINAIRGA